VRKSPAGGETIISMLIRNILGIIFGITVYLVESNVIRKSRGVKLIID
jgi:hypothetical protein